MNRRWWSCFRLYKCRRALASAVGLMLTAFAAGCGWQGRPVQHPLAFVLRFPGADLDGASKTLTQAFLREARSHPEFIEPHPMEGLIETTLSTNDPGVEEFHCVPGSPSSDTGIRCVLLSREGDFLLIQLIDHAWTRAFFFKIYVVPRFFLGRIDPAYTSLVAVAPILSADSADERWRTVDETLSDALRSLSAIVYGTGRP